MTVSDLEDEKERESATEIISTISEHPGCIEFENADKEHYSRLIPFPSGICDDRMAACNNWRYDQGDCQMESVLSKNPRNCSDLSLRPWGAAQRRQRKFEVSKVSRDVKMEDIPLEDGEFCWTTFANIIKPLFMPMEPQARFTAANHFADYLKGESVNNK
ncbi:hypothetical protein KIN20_027198 [Parelaphostrongylus tenuis]|uniref:Uncharacterized protein n=1 Tax=Parelaphostrongylus tenuis TaxID=148309 RepID=A0AAD5QZE9_PARTN|nr:hypothetical protein KIN20_027198 [Parelaphostrongylus tenuis]